MSFLFQLSRSKSLTSKSREKSVKEPPSKNPSDCPLNNPEIGVISEVDHNTSTCLCSLCTCHKHICPGTFFHEPYPKSSYKTQYSTNYQSKVLNKTEKFSYISNFLPIKPVDFETTNHSFYTPHLSRPTTTIENTRSQSRPRTALSTATTYGGSYMHWEVSAFPHMKQHHIKHSNSEAKLVDNTIYKDSFQGKPTEIFRNRLNATFQSSVYLDFHFPNQSIQRQDYRKFPRKYVSKKETKASDSVKLQPSQSQYLTVTKKDYIRKPIKIDTRTLSKALKKRANF